MAFERALDSCALMLAGIVPAFVACTQPPKPVMPTILPGDIPVDVRVRVIAASLPGGWHPARLIRSEEGCRVVTVAVPQQPTPIAVLNMGEINRLQLSQAMPPPDWWAELREEEGWTEMDPLKLRNESRRCRSHYPAEPAGAGAATLRRRSTY